MAEYNPQEIEKKWRQKWAEEKVFKAEVDASRPKFYVLDMFPYPSGAGLHVGHPLGYIASDIVSRFKRIKGFNVLHPMGFDAFGLPAEQYAIQTGQHPAITTEENIKRYKEQLRNLGFSFDWDKEVQTCDPAYYKWTQWIFMQLFRSWYNKDTDKAEPIETLIEKLEKDGNKNVNGACDEDTPIISADDWNNYSDHKKQAFLLNYRLTYPDEAVVNWCPDLGTVLANDEVKDGYSERGGHPVIRKKMQQWMMRITAYADRLQDNLEKLEWSDAMKEMQTNWIGKSYGCELDFKVADKDITLTAFTTRPDTIYGVTYVVLAPEHELVKELTKPEQKEAVENYVTEATNRSERERMADVKTVSGVFTGSYVINPFTNEKVPLWVADYVLAGYGTGVVMAVPSSDDRDFRFANHFDLPIIRVIEGTEQLEDPTEIKHGKMINSGILNGIHSEKAIQVAIDHAEKQGFGEAKVNYKMRDAVFSRQRYWGEPVPVFYKDGLPYLIDESELPLKLPQVDEYKPTSTGEPPLGRAKDWKYKGEYPYELTTMPGWAGSSWYFLRYMDAKNDKEFVSPEAVKYWNEVDLYIGGTEHATGHLLYSRFWNLFLYDRGFIFHEEPFKKLVNQGMIQGRSNLAYYLLKSKKFVSKGIFKKLIENHPDYQQLRNENINAANEIPYQEIHVDVNLVGKDDDLDIEKFKNWQPAFKNAEFILENGKYICGHVIEKMSKRYYNVVNPDDIIQKYGADTLRMYEMFLGPIQDSKPWNTHGIDGVAKFLRRFWNLFHDNKGNFGVSDDKPTAEELKVLHKTLKKVEEDVDNLSFNTTVSEFMICVNELNQLKCNKKTILEPLVIALSPYAPHIAEELWHLLGYEQSVIYATYPKFEEKYLVEEAHEYPIMVNGKMRTKINFPLDKPNNEIEQEVVQNEVVQKWLEGKAPKKIIVVPKKIVNVVV